MANKKEKKSVGFTDLKILVFFIVGASIGLAIGLFYFNWLMTEYVVSTRRIIDQDWVKVQYYANRVGDQAVKLKKMAAQDKVKFDFEKTDNVIDARSRMIGSDRIEDKAKFLTELEAAISALIGYYNGRMDLKDRRFSYIEWGMITAKYIDEYNENRMRYAESAVAYNNVVSKWPFSGIAKGKKLGLVPIGGGNGIEEVKLNREEYEKNDGIFRMDKNEGSSSSAGSY